MSMEYEIGGDVMISGQWFRVLDTDDDDTVRVDFAEVGATWIPVAIIHRCRPPKPKEWLTEENVCAVACSPGAKVKTVQKILNDILTAKYGAPPK